MVVPCCVCGEKRPRGSYVTFHKFPKNKIQKRKWLRQLKGRVSEISYRSKICSRHFVPECFDRDEEVGITSLRRDAIPTLFSVNNTPVTQSQCDKPVVKPIVKQKPIVRRKVERKVYNPPDDALKNKRKYYLSYTEEDLQYPYKVQRFLLTVKQETERQEKKIQEIMVKKNKLAKKLYSLQYLLHILKQESLVSHSATSVLELSLPGSSAEVLGRMRYGIKTRNYPAELCAFALSAQLYLDKQKATFQRLSTLVTHVRLSLQNGVKLFMLHQALLKKPCPS